MNIQERFFVYSMRHQRAVKVCLMTEEGIKQMNMTVVSMDDEKIFYYDRKKKKVLSVVLQDILSVGYAKGDKGDTLTNLERELAEHEAENPGTAQG